MLSNVFNKLNSTYIIAEIGVNHNGDLKLAKNMIGEAMKAGADAVKFQTFTAENLVSIGTPKVEYQKNTTSKSETHYEMIQKLELSRENHVVLKDYCDKLGIDFLSTPYDVESVQFLDQLGVKYFKTASADIVDAPLQSAIARTMKPAIISVGMANLGEIEKLINLYYEIGNKNIILLHCVSNYPCSDKSLNLKVMNTLSNCFQIPIGFSDHSVGSEASVIAIAYGSKIIEKHFTLDKNLDGPDHKASSTPDEFQSLVLSVRRAENMLGDGQKKCQDEEYMMSEVSRKSIVLAKNIQKGDIITSDHLIMKRPGTGLSADLLPLIIGCKVNEHLEKDTILNIQSVV